MILQMVLYQWDEPLDGVGPYSYFWVGGPMAQTWSGLGAGTYTIIVVDNGTKYEL